MSVVRRMAELDTSVDDVSKNAGRMLVVVMVMVRALL
jgi:hypothetical protein